MPCDAWDEWETRHATALGRLTFLFVALGVAWRIGRYLMAMPIWGDEAMLLVNYQTRTYADVFGPIEHCQIAPLLFHWAEMAAYHNLGPSEWSVRLPPLLGSLAALVLFCLLARLLLSPLPRMFAVAVLSVAIWPATTGSLVKPYSWDLFFSVALLLPFVAWRRERQRRWPLILLCLLAPVALTASYTSVFVAGAIAILLFPPFGAGGRGRALGPHVALPLLYTALVAISFFAHYHFVGKVHLASTTYGLTTEYGMATFWKNAFPPSDPVQLSIWIPLTLAGEMAAYPIGAQRGGSVVTLAICLLGAWSLWRRQQSDLLLLFAAVFVLWFIAAALHKYPMGPCRLGQHAAPIYCLLAGAGGAELLRRIMPPGRAWAGVAAIVLLLIAVGIGGMVRDVIRPYRDSEARDSRDAVRAILDASDAPILVPQSRQDIRIATVHYYLGASDRVRWVDSNDWSAVVKDHPSLWVVVCSPAGDSNERSSFLDSLRRAGGNWAIVEQRAMPLSGTSESTIRAYLFVREPVQQGT
jgi:4-amino-4-deoxy-L-arabinose transferase-like glycosyltransferase